jgi:hypothetical protein
MLINMHPYSGAYGRKISAGRVASLAVRIRKCWPRASVRIGLDCEVLWGGVSESLFCRRQDFGPMGLRHTCVWRFELRLFGREDFVTLDLQLCLLRPGFLQM